MIPSGYKEDVVYSQIPTSGAGDLSFTRASNGTRVNSAGLVEVCPWNLLEYSEQFDNGAWSAVNCSIVANDAVAPNGTTTADKFTTTSTTTECQVRASNFSILSNVGIPFTTSVYAKKGTANFLRIRNLFSTVTVIERNGWFNLNTGTLGTIDAGQTGTITDVGNGWYRCTLTGLVGSGGNGNLLDIGFTNADNTSFPTTSVYGYLWGAQLNIGSTAKPYFPTTDRLNVPRLTYQNGGGGCPSLLLEKQSTNLLTYSEQFDNANWTKNGATITANTTISPDGTQNADTLTGASGNYRIYQIVGGLSSIDYTFSVFAKKGTANLIWLDFINVGDGPSFNFTTKAWSAASGWTTSYEEHANGWFRLIATKASNTTSAGLGIKVGAVNETVYLWGAQMEAGSYKTSYIATTSSSATRVADGSPDTATLLSNKLSYSVFLDFYPRPLGNFQYFFIQKNSSANAEIIWGGTSGGTDFAIYDYTAGSICNVAINDGNRHKIVLSQASGKIDVFVDGSQVATQKTTSATGFYYVAFDGNPGIYKINELAIMSKITNADAIALTTL